MRVYIARVIDEQIKKETRGGFRPGAGRPRGSQSKTNREQWAQRLGEIKKRLMDHGLGKVEMQPSQVKALEVLLDRLEPRLSAIEHTEANPRDAADPAQLAARLAALFNEKPHLFEQVMALKNASQPLQVVEQQRDPLPTTH
ncbi:MAG TPA: hypothetical protein VFA99_14495 [Acidobacteriaceae bacterium]|nr:hypothetical protein [Acidobacteriaceae bacterium]